MVWNIIHQQHCRINLLLNLMKLYRNQTPLKYPHLHQVLCTFIPYLLLVSDTFIAFFFVQGVGKQYFTHFCPFLRSMLRVCFRFEYRVPNSFKRSRTFPSCIIDPNVQLGMIPQKTGFRLCCASTQTFLAQK